MFCWGVVGKPRMVLFPPPLLLCPPPTPPPPVGTLTWPEPRFPATAASQSTTFSSGAQPIIRADFAVHQKLRFLTMVYMDESILFEM